MFAAADGIYFMIKGAVEMEFRVEKKESFRVVGVSAPLQGELEKNFENVPKLWGRAASDGTLEKLAAMMDSQPMGILGVCAYGNGEAGRYYIAVSSARTDASLEEYIVPAALWAIFPGEGPSQSVQELERRILTEWLPASGYEYGLGPDIEVYYNADPQNAKYEVWIPVVKKN